jgi:O-acetyl-ADP-ribose deacetylase (regulator of RNase III)
MCFSNLPIEFDEEGNPYLAEEADDIEHVTDCGCGTDDGIDEADPEAVFEAVLSSVPEPVREEVGEREGDHRETTPGDLPVDGNMDDPAEGD